ncbi:MAG TPA: AmmeMemoRadiSam system radical SAM enzyme [Blastocatellia bacterium]|jgi:pyruvate formate lyase activating enzyme|nr:AmmeMemoRadiSam system radical SAM enzyme [Blastocatellia bacterium]
MAAPVTLKNVLKEYTTEGEIYDRLEGDRVRCYACGHRCLILPGLDGICRVRYNEGGRLMVPAGYVAALQCDPTEKKPFFHAYPGSLALTFGMLGCDYHCSYCQNWVTSQALRDPKAVAPPREVEPGQMVEVAKRYGARLVVSSYNEPLITSEWAVSIFKEAKPEGFVCGYVSNGNATPEVLDYIRPWADVYKIDLKGFQDKSYRKLGGVLENVLDTIKMVYERGFWLEIVTLVIPGFNDSTDELKAAADFIAGVSPDIPWHVTAFHQDYKMTGPDNTSVETLIRTAEIGYGAGLNYVYAGNIPGRVGKYENTFCPGCKTALIERYGFRVLKNRIKDGACPACETKIPGRWE